MVPPPPNTGVLYKTAQSAFKWKSNVAKTDRDKGGTQFPTGERGRRWDDRGINSTKTEFPHRRVMGKGGSNGCQLIINFIHPSRFLHLFSFASSHSPVKPFPPAPPPIWPGITGSVGHNPSSYSGLIPPATTLTPLTSQHTVPQLWTWAEKI